jgi:GT2 family glycosyltransferase
MERRVDKITAIILNYIRWEDTAACVHSLKECTYPALEIVILDNDSPNDSVTHLKAQFSDIEVIQTGMNRGYTGGINYGIKYSQERGSDYILIINPDTLVEPDFLEPLVSALEKCPTAAATCGTIHCYPETSMIWYAGGRLIPCRGLAVHNKIPPLVKHSEIQDYRKVTFITGCLILLRTNLINIIGLQDERFFMYLDDIEYSARILKRGFDLLYVPGSKIYHRMDAHAKENPFKLYYSVRNRLLLIDAAFDGMTRIVAKYYFIVIISYKLIVWRVFNLELYRAAIAGLYDYYNHNFGEGRGVKRFLYNED